MTAATCRPKRDTKSPTAPAGLVATAGDRQVALNWTASTDNVGVAGYKVFRNGAQATTVAGTSFTDTGLTNGASYSYYVVATDAAGNVSPASNTVSAASNTVPATSSGGASWSHGWGSWDTNRWPDATWRPFADNAWINSTHGDSTNYVANDAAMVASARNGMGVQGVWTGVGADDWSHPYYFSHASDPAYTVHCNVYACPTMENQTLHMPTGIKPAGGGDGHMTILDQATGYEWDFYHATSPSGAGGTYTAGTGARFAISGDGTNPGGSGADAAATGLLAGPVRPEELSAAATNGSAVPHALFMVIHCTNGKHVYPANNNAGGSCADAAPTGQLFKIAYSDAEINALAIPAWKKALVKALAHYGAYVLDTGGGGGIGFQFVSQQTYATYGAAGWNAFLGQAGVGGSSNSVNFELNSGVDWSRLHAVNPCVVAGSC